MSAKVAVWSLVGLFLITLGALWIDKWLTPTGMWHW